MESRITGLLKKSANDAEAHESKAMAIPYFNGQALKVRYAATNAAFLAAADDALEKFMQLDGSDRINDSEMVHACYSRTLNYLQDEPIEISGIDDIWNYVRPLNILIDMKEDGITYLCISCDCDWKEENGLQLVFKNGECLSRASGHDGHYSD